MEIQYISVDALIPYEHNAKRHPDEQVEHIANSIRQFGFKQPIVIDRDNVVVIGHGRLLAAKKLGMETVPCIMADDLTGDQIRALRLADNKTNESAWDFEALDIELDSIDIDMSEFGFNINDDVEPYTGDGVKEYNQEDFDDDKFEHKCPKCGFLFND